MNPQVERLEALLARVRQNAGKPRVWYVPVPAGESQPPSGAPVSGVATISEFPSSEGVSMNAAPPTEMELDEPSLSEPPPAGGGRDDVFSVDADEIVLDEDAPPESGPGLVGGAQTLEEVMNRPDSAPPMTPPPESGEEPAPKVTIPRDRGPTMEQLGNTISLEEAGATEFELDEVTRAATPVPPDDSLQADLPRSIPPTMDDNLELPANAREELERVRLGQRADVKPVVVARPLLSTNVVEFVSAAREFAPQSFLDLLDASLSL